MSRLRWGSSPRVRGKHLGGGALDAERGLIPARAGKTTWTARGGRGTTAHPRACGENARAVRRCAQRWGSSPRVRGKLMWQQ
ncbi:hypothetical protein HMPREF9005_1181 [Actinomyces sp. oral taxon 178 str. F0338]|nr:hypothetical protein HMPREF9005_1181 [Actinomyces sp. oral taxon 178 str. F0338]